MHVAVNVEQLCQPTPGGIGRYTARLLNQLSALSHADSYTGFTALHSGSVVRHAMATAGVAVPVSVLPLPRPLLYDSWHMLGRAAPQSLSRRLRHADLVHAPSLAVPAVREHTGLVVTVHDVAHLLFPETFTRRGRRFHTAGLRAARERSDLVICPSEAAAADLADLEPALADRVRVVPHGVDVVTATSEQVGAARRRSGVPDVPYLFWVGTIEPRKNLPLLLDAFRFLVDETDLPHHLVLAGPTGWLDAAEDVSTRARRLGTRLHTPGRLSEVDLHALYAGADCFVFPSRYEGFGLPVLEAMAHGTPVVCAANSALPEVAGGAARLVAGEEPEAWAGAVSEILGDEEARRRLSDLGRARAGRFSWQTCAAATRDVYSEVVAAKS